ncbi:MAG: FAD-dependent oxidoreductase [Alphaproteobacteria bacterium]|nr:FAD-dependent oxidoreductase [Alphaproteobacteria bacterium]
MVKFIKKYDIVVAGAGTAGIAAALAAARHGKKVALIERQTIIGGLATSGLVFVYLPLCDGQGTQVTFGIAEELLRSSINYGPFGYAKKWGGVPGLGTTRERFACHFSPAGFTLTLDKKLAEAGVDLWLDTLICDSNVTADRQVTSIEVENVSGRGRVEAKCFVDASGDAIIVRRANGAFVTEKNYIVPWFIQACENLKSPLHFKDCINMGVLNSSQEEYLAGDALDGKDVTAFTRSVWNYIRKYFDENYASGEYTRQMLFPLNLPAMPQFRKIAAVKGVKTLQTGNEWTYFDDSVGIYGDWRKPGSVWETPYGTLVPENTRGVLTAGRCISTIGDAWETFRVIPAAVMTGEISGTAAALSLNKKCDPIELPINDLREELRKNHFKFHFEELGISKKAASESNNKHPQKEYTE